MSVRPHPSKGPGVWVIDFYPHGRGGKRERVPFYGTFDEAVKTEHSLRIQAKGSAPGKLFPKVSEVVPEFMQWYRLDHQSSGSDRTQISLNLLKQHFGAYQFTSITEELVEQYKRIRLKEVKPTTINKELAALSKLCKWARKKGYCAKIPMIERFPDKLTRAPLPSIPGQDDIERLIAAIPWPKQGIFYGLYYGGLRAQEAARLRAEDIDLQAKTMHVLGKGNKLRVVPVLKYMVPILERRLSEVQSGYLWATANGVPLKDLRGTIEWARKRAKITAKITPHSLRHAFGVRAVMAGVHLRTIQIVLGHSSSKVTEIYTRLAGQQIALEMEKF